MTTKLLCTLLLLAGCGTSSPATDAGADLATAPPDLTAPTVYTVFIRGTLKNDPATSKMIHDQVAQAGKAKALMLGDSGHYVFLSLPQPSTQFLAIDLWNSLDGL